MVRREKPELSQMVSELLKIEELAGYEEFKNLQPTVADALRAYACLEYLSNPHAEVLEYEGENLLCKYEIPIVRRTLQALIIRPSMEIDVGRWALKEVMAELILAEHDRSPGIISWAQEDEENLTRSLCLPGGQTLWEMAEEILMLAQDTLSLSDLAHLMWYMREHSGEVDGFKQLNCLIDRIDQLLPAIKETKAAPTIGNLPLFCQLATHLPVVILEESTSDVVAEVYESLWLLWRDSMSDS